jgi:hypothetical protein
VPLLSGTGSPYNAGKNFKALLGGSRDFSSLLDSRLPFFFSLCNRNDTGEMSFTSWLLLQLPHTEQLLHLQAA